MKWYFWLLALIFSAVIYKIWFAKANLRADRSISITARQLREVSGLVTSIGNEGHIWVHNDGSRSLRLFLVSADGVLKQTFKFPDVQTEDFEDIAIGRGRDGRAVVYAGDIGDNGSRRKAVRVARLYEPMLGDSVGKNMVDTFFLRYPDGSRDAEAMLVDPLMNELFIISKREETPHIYKTSIEVKSMDTVEMKLVGKLKLQGAGMLKWVTAADISADGTKVLVRSYGNVYYWKRTADEPLEEMFKRSPKTLSHTSEIQGEAIGFSQDGRGFYTISEGRKPALNYNYIRD